MDLAVTAALREHYTGFSDVDVHRLPISYANDVFLIEKRGRIAVAKVTSLSAGSRDRAANQASAVEIVGELSPFVIRTKDGSAFCDISLPRTQAPADASHPVASILALFAYAEGKTLFEFLDHARSPPLQLMVEYGHAIGSLGRHMQRFKAPTAARVPPGLERLACQSGTAAFARPGVDASADICSWDLRHALVHADAAAAIADVDVRALAVAALAEFHRVMVPQYEAAEADARCRCSAASAASPPGLDAADPDADSLLRMSWVHGDANDFNILVTHPHERADSKQPNAAGSASTSTPASVPVPVSAYAQVDVSDWCPPEARSAAAAASPGHGHHHHDRHDHHDHDTHRRRLVVIDWDDLSFSFAVHEPAVALAYLLMDRADPLATAAAFLRGLAEVCPLTRSEVASLLTLVRTRLAVSLASSGAAAAAARADGDTGRAAYIEVHATPAARLLRYLSQQRPQLASSSEAGAAAPAAAGAAVVEAEVALDRDVVDAGEARGLGGAAATTAGLGSDFASVHTAPYVGDAAATARLMVACGHLEPPRPQRSYRRRPVLPAEQVATSRATLLALDALAAAGQLHPITPAVLQAGEADAAAAAASQPSGAAKPSSNESRLPPSSSQAVGYIPDAGRRYCATPAGWWSVPPLLYDFTARAGGSTAAHAPMDAAGAAASGPVAGAADATGAPAPTSSSSASTAVSESASASASAGASPLAAVVGTDPVKLQAFTAMMFEPLALPPASSSAAAPGATADADAAETAGGSSAATAPDGAAASGDSSASTSASASSSASAAAAQALPLRLRIGWGRYNEDRMIYTSGHFTGGAPAAGADTGAVADGAGPLRAAASDGSVRGAASDSEARTLHMGVDVELPAGSPINAPLPGRVHSWARNWAELDYGPAIVLQHTLRLRRRHRHRHLSAASAVDAGATSSGSSSGSSSSSSGHGKAAEASEGAEGGSVVTVTFYTLYGHLSLSSILNPDGSWRLHRGQLIPAGGVVGWVGGPHVNGGWPPHLHLQLNTEAEHGGWQGDYPGVCARGDWNAYRLLCPDPNALLRCPFVAPLGPWGGAPEDAGAAAACGGAAFDEVRGAAAAACTDSAGEWEVDSVI